MMAETQAAPTNTVRVLVLDDNASFTALLAMLLHEQGCQVDMALEGESGLRLLAEKSYDILLVDLNLPDMQGDAFIEIARQCAPAIKSVLVSANPDVNQVAKTCHADDAFFKGESVMTLYSKVLALATSIEGVKAA